MNFNKFMAYFDLECRQNAEIIVPPYCIDASETDKLKKNTL